MALTYYQIADLTLTLSFNFCRHAVSAATLQAEIA